MVGQDSWCKKHFMDCNARRLHIKWMSFHGMQLSKGSWERGKDNREREG